MADLDKETIYLSRRSCRYTVPDDLKFVTLVRVAGEGTVRIRLSRGRDTTLDIPLSVESLSDLIQATGHMFGTLPAELPQAIEEYRQQGGPVVDE